MQNLILISMDALVYEDLEYLKAKPSFNWMLKNGSIVERVRSIYPTLTYPCHISMSTGRYPDSHGVLNNTDDLIGSLNSPWKFEHQAVKGKDLLDACKKAGLSTASVGWPVSGHHPSVDYLVDECWPVKGNTLDDYKKAYLDTGTSQELFENTVEPFLWMRVGRRQPESSYFLTRISAEIIRRYKPNVLTLHIGNVDAYRHKTGVFSQLVTQGLDQCEEMLRLLIEATKDAGTFERTNFVVTSDHGQLDVVRTVHLNKLFADNGLIKTDDNNRIISCDAYCFTAEMSARVCIKDNSNLRVVEKVRSLLENACQSGLWGISKIYTREEVAKDERLDGDFDFVIETDNYSRFDEKWFGNPVTSMELGERGCVHGSHGFHPDKGLRPPFLACGPAIKTGVILPSARLVDGAPTCAAILKVPFLGVDGAPLTQILK